MANLGKNKLIKAGSKRMIFGESVSLNTTCIMLCNLFGLRWWAISLMNIESGSHGTEHPLQVMHAKLNNIDLTKLLIINTYEEKVCVSPHISYSSPSVSTSDCTPIRRITGSTQHCVSRQGTETLFDSSTESSTWFI